MITIIEHKIPTVNGKIIEKKINSLTFQVTGSQFPLGTVNNNADRMLFKSDSENTVTVNFGDGNVISYSFVFVSNSYQFEMNPYNNVGGEKYGKHDFTDGNSGTRNITFTFSNIEAITDIDFLYCRLQGSFPVEINACKRLNYLRLYRTKELTAFPITIAQNKNLKTLDLRDISPSKLDKIPDAIFELGLEVFSGYEVFNLANKTSSNFFKINQWKDTLKFLDLTNCDIVELPESIKECVNVEEARFFINDFNEFPTQLNSLYKLQRLYLGNNDYNFNVKSDWADLSNLNVLQYLLLTNRDLSLNNLQIVFQGLKSLTTILMGSTTFVNNSSRFNEFVESFYQLITENAFVNPTSAEALADDYPNQFRNIAWGHGSLAVDTPVEAHPNYVSGQYFGAAQTNGQRVYEMIDQYNHVITYA